ncbi:MAG TPA: hypothetical protein VNZ27_14040 [Rhodanobacter sp.]|nr:hypothetical protein [Rhodanobacter sp.]
MTDILIGRNDSTSVSLDPHYGNRHGMIETFGKQIRTADPARCARWHFQWQALSAR